MGAVGADLDERLSLAAAELERIGVWVLVACVSDRMVTLGVPAATATNRVDRRTPRQRSPRRWSGGRRLLRPSHLGMRPSGRKGGGRARQPQRRQPARKRDPTHRRGASHLRLPWRHTSILLHLQRPGRWRGSRRLTCDASLARASSVCFTQNSSPFTLHSLLECLPHGISTRLSR